MRKLLLLILMMTAVSLNATMVQVDNIEFIRFFKRRDASDFVVKDSGYSKVGLPSRDVNAYLLSVGSIIFMFTADSDFWIKIIEREILAAGKKIINGRII